MYRNNRAKSSANFYKAFAAGIWHNTRFGNKPLSSFAEYEHRNIANLSFEAVKEIEAKLLEERSQKYMETHNQKFQCKTAFIELVVNMREHHTLANLGLIKGAFFGPDASEIAGVYQEHSHDGYVGAFGTL